MKLAMLALFWKIPMGPVSYSTTVLHQPLHHVILQKLPMLGMPSLHTRTLTILVWRLGCAPIIKQRYTEQP